MTKLKTSLQLETAFGGYAIDEIIGEGGAGRVFGGRSEAGDSVAVKVLTNKSSDKRRRFKNEVAFLARNKHANIVTVVDYGVAAHAAVAGPFYVMKRYASNLRDVMRGKLTPEQRLHIFRRSSTALKQRISRELFIEISNLRTFYVMAAALRSRTSASRASPPTT